jgi:NAD(P)-dependent dehydrogenase (short-subunit alcohol dehydrogenase family)
MSNLGERAGEELQAGALQDKVILITGAGRGNGRLLAEALARRAAIVAANDVTPVNIEPLVEGIRGAGGRGYAFVEDIARKMAAQALVNRVEEQLGGIDVLINHAAVEPHVPLLEMDEWDWHRTLDVNLTGAFLMMQSVARVMRVRGGGVIMNLLGATDAAQGGTAAAYEVCAGALLSLTRAAARELAPLGIRVHALVSGLVEAGAEDRNGPTTLTTAVLQLLAGRDLNGSILRLEKT